MSVPDRSRPACLLLHGYGGTPFEMEGLARSLEEAGFVTRVPCLPGHDSDSDRFASFRFADWLAFAENELAALRADYNKVVIAGFSMGGTLALNLAARYPVAGIVTLSTPLYVLHVSPWPVTHAVFYAATGIAQLGKMAGFGEKKDGEKKETSREIAPWKGYGGPFNLPQLYSFRRGCIETRKLLPRLTAPLLVMHDANDRIVYAGNACEIARRVSSARAAVVYTRIRETATRHHMIVTHRETEAFVAETVTRFCREVCPE